MAGLTEQQVRDMLHGISIPSQPQIMVDLQLEEIMPGPDINRIAKLISQDAGLSASVIKVANSSLLAPEEPIISIREAVKLLGIKTVINITNGLSIKGEMSDFCFGLTQAKNDVCLTKQFQEDDRRLARSQ